MRRDAESTANGKSTLIIAGACETDFVLLRDGSRSQAKGSNKRSGSVGARLGEQCSRDLVENRCKRGRDRFGMVFGRWDRV